MWIPIALGNRAFCICTVISKHGAKRVSSRPEGGRATAPDAMARGWFGRMGIWGRVSVKSHGQPRLAERDLKLQSLLQDADRDASDGA